MTQQEIQCLECGNMMKTEDDTQKGEIINCSDCGSDWEILSPQFNIIRIKKAERISEDWGE